MTTVINNFVTIRKNRGDVLESSVARSVIEAIRGILNEYNYLGVKDAAELISQHMTDYNDPHQDANYLFWKIAEQVYDIYTNMTATPISLNDFKTNLVPSIAYPELLRRIALNRYLYNKIKNLDGSVNSNISVTLPSEYSASYIFDNAVPVLIGDGITNETDFIRLGYLGNTYPANIIYNANNLIDEVSDSELMFSTSSTSPYQTMSDVGNGYSVDTHITLPLSLNVQIMGTPTVSTPIVTLSGPTDTLSVVLNPNRTINVLHNGNVINSGLIISDSGSLSLIISRQGDLQILSSNSGLDGFIMYTSIFSHLVLFTSLTLNVGLESLFGNSFGIRSISLHKGITSTREFQDSVGTFTINGFVFTMNNTTSISVPSIINYN